MRKRTAGKAQIEADSKLEQRLAAELPDVDMAPADLDDDFWLLDIEEADSPHFDFGAPAHWLSQQTPTINAHLLA